MNGLRTLAVGFVAVTLAACGSERIHLAQVPEADAGSGGTGAGGAQGSNAGAGGAGLGLDLCGLAARGIVVEAVDLDGYPPYAVDGCMLAFVSSPDSSYGGALVLRDLAAGTDTVLAPAERTPRRPSIANPVVTWEEMDGTTRVVRVYDGTNTVTLAGPFDHAGEPRATMDAVVFTGWLTSDDNGDTDVFLYTLASASVDLVLGGVNQQRFSDVSPTHIAISDFVQGSYDPAGIAPADVVVVNRSTGDVVRRVIDGKQAYPMLGANGRLIYLEWIGVRPMPKLEGYDVRGVGLDALDAPGVLLASVDTDPPAIRPAARGDTIEWVQRAGTVSTLMRVPADASAPPAPVSGLDGLDLYAPAASTSFTVLAASVISPGALLEAVPR